MPVNATLRSAELKQKLLTDMMEKFLITVSDPLQLTMQTAVENKSKQELGKGLQGHLLTLL
jgi:hypothetical protein